MFSGIYGIIYFTLLLPLIMLVFLLFFSLGFISNWFVHVIIIKNINRYKGKK